MPRKENPGPISAQQQQDLVSEGIDNFELPKSIVTKIAKSAIPENTKLQKETILSLVKGSTVFINYLAATAHDVAQSKQHKSISASDVLKALEMIELGDLVEPLSAELQAYRELNKTDKGRRASTNSASRSKTDAGVIRVPSSVENHASTNSAFKNKGKQKTVDSPFISTPLPGANTSAPASVSASASISASGDAINPDSREVEAPQDDPMAVDEGAGEVEDGDQEMVVGDEEEMDEDEGEGEGEGDEGGAEDDLQDMVALEEEEQQQDAKSVEERGSKTEHVP